MIELVRYHPALENEWNKLCEQSRIDTFLFNRNFMDYHRDRFMDFSFIIYKNEKIEGLLPGHVIDNSWYSHQGLTYGGLVTTMNIKSKDVQMIFLELNEHLKREGIKNVIYKPTPYIYHNNPTSEDIYFLFQFGAKKIACNLSTTILLSEKQSFSDLRKRGVKKALKKGFEVAESNDFESFWSILEYNLIANYNKKPVHSLEEIKMLKNKFNDNIRLYCAFDKGLMSGGVVVFSMKKVAHVQYIAATDFGKKYGALDLLFYCLINEEFKHNNYFDFGISTEKMGRYLNEGLIFQKEGFGGRGVVYDTYKYSLK